MLVFWPGVACPSVGSVASSTSMSIWVAATSGATFCSGGLPGCCLLCAGRCRPCTSRMGGILGGTLLSSKVCAPVLMPMKSFVLVVSVGLALMSHGFRPLGCCMTLQSCHPAPSSACVMSWSRYHVGAPVSRHAVAVGGGVVPFVCRMPPRGFGEILLLCVVWLFLQPLNGLAA